MCRRRFGSAQPKERTYLARCLTMGVLLEGTSS